MRSAGGPRRETLAAAQAPRGQDAVTAMPPVSGPPDERQQARHAQPQQHGAARLGHFGHRREQAHAFAPHAGLHFQVDEPRRVLDRLSNENGIATPVRATWPIALGGVDGLLVDVLITPVGPGWRSGTTAWRRPTAAARRSGWCRRDAGRQCRPRRRAAPPCVATRSSRRPENDSWLIAWYSDGPPSVGEPACPRASKLRVPSREDPWTRPSALAGPSEIARSEALAQSGGRSRAAGTGERRRAGDGQAGGKGVSALRRDSFSAREATRGSRRTRSVPRLDAVSARFLRSPACGGGPAPEARLPRPTRGSW
ncbi:MAG: hypothetical protein MZU95_07455 [Desulfomicrobium escambiense]|nr:hypothetical protein [Desulfomicrobium escambiense]